MKRSTQFCSSSKLQTVFPKEEGKESQKEEGKEEQVKKQPHHHLLRLWYGQFLMTLALSKMLSLHFQSQKISFQNFAYHLTMYIKLYGVVNSGHSP